ncbi:alpha/beta fold hydrolase [Lederbergia wuyishanensis]|uniref:Pimeloyl-ACP methyl ester carboxylesterase n=1 Tax=Lederbergia wuyishanensis TaxID=1347903 RepID=A0ABU0D976_9BACI|nr:alpha/beta hydrolase [Lederbergia wuyishanensis]MCJ8009468.1 alpha/beta hydrolase [Lederbergia wuyishanensis]MDQ0344922.1 pimeloyl-ACP methyl ester carboxylesterase [Lederbergia wuyishanensis]
MPIGSSIKINDISIYYEEYKHPNALNTIVLIHGFLSSSFSFRRLIPYLEKDVNIVSIDFPPFGKSGKSLKFSYTYANIASTILELLDTLGYKNIIATGHSMGGQIVLNMSIQRPEFIKKAILISCSGYVPRAKLPLRMLTYVPFIGRFIKLYLEKSGVEGNLNIVVYDKSIIDEKMIKGYEEPFHHNEIFRALAKMLRHREGDLAPVSLQSIQTPCLLLWGDHDTIVPLNIGNRLAYDLPNSSLVVIKNTGHLLPEEKPKEVYDEIIRFI